MKDFVNLIISAINLNCISMGSLLLIDGLSLKRVGVKYQGGKLNGMDTTRESVNFINFYVVTPPFKRFLYSHG